ncbi:GntR family transcriptional regulator [Microbacterium sp. LWS13-1.2]|uniref:GntR family transcriptional regulator n=1 Tax=Microbacterium sp. LWS13-1.2 TaxID=3135264 RepID=A0AAU6SBK5_9MICO
MRASEHAYAALLEEIQVGILPPGAVLGEVEQAARFGVSRTPLREAIGRLVADGLAVQQSPRVTVVAAMDADDIRQLFTVRRSLEETAARLAAARREAARAFDALARAFAAVTLGDADARDDYYSLIAAFDAELDRAAANDYLSAALRTLRTHLVRVRRLARDNPERLTRSVQEHHLIAAAIADGNAELAAHATHIHLHNALEFTLAALPDTVAPDSEPRPPSRRPKGTA